MEVFLWKISGLTPGPLITDHGPQTTDHGPLTTDHRRKIRDGGPRRRSKDRETDGSTLNINKTSSIRV